MNSIRAQRPIGELSFNKGFMCRQIGGDYAATVTDCDSRAWVFTTNNLTAHTVQFCEQLGCNSGGLLTAKSPYRKGVIDFLEESGKGCDNAKK